MSELTKKSKVVESEKQRSKLRLISKGNWLELDKRSHWGSGSVRGETLTIKTRKPVLNIWHTTDFTFQ